MTVEDIAQKLRARLGEAPDFHHAVLLDFGAEGRLRIDTRDRAAPVIDHNSTPAECTLHMRLEDFVALAQKKLDPQMAYMTGRLKVEGDLMVAMQLGRLLS